MAMAMTAMSDDVPRNSHDLFFEERDWSAPVSFWRQLLTVTDTDKLPAFVTGLRKPFGLTNLQEIHAAGQRGEFSSKDSRYLKKKTFALRIGYDGLAYQGYQRQINLPEGARTVEGDLKIALGLSPYGAGRTDKGVSAISQVVCVSSNETMTADRLIERMRSSAPVIEGRLQVYDCQRVPKKFNARSSATWRRYLFLFPLAGTGGNDVDVEFVDKMLSRLVDRPLPYNALAFGENRVEGQGLQDICTLYHATAYIVERQQEDTKMMCVELVGTRFLRRMVRIIVATAVREAVKDPDRVTRNENLLVDICQEGKRHLAASPVRGDGLCLAGVGYDCKDLAIYKFMPKRAREEIEQQDALGLPYSEEKNETLLS